jgi:hypothetical protein
VVDQPFIDSGTIMLDRRRQLTVSCRFLRCGVAKKCLSTTHGLHRHLQISVAKLSATVGEQFFIKFPGNAYKHTISKDSAFFGDSNDIYILIYGLLLLGEYIILLL